MGREMIHVLSPGQVWAWVHCCYGDFTNPLAAVFGPDPALVKQR